MTAAELRRERVKRGEEWLDLNRPGWFNEVDLDHLNMSIGTRCVLGQLYSRGGNWQSALDRSGLNWTNTVTMGFADQSSGEAPLLQVLWLETISRRRLAEAQTRADTTPIFRLKGGGFRVLGTWEDIQTLIGKLGPGDYKVKEVHE